MLDALAKVFEAQMIDLLDPKVPIKLPGAVSSSHSLAERRVFGSTGP
jgi:hypothetical protein